jgi:3-oxoacyl-[acyl-carrier-protein] synthase-1
LIPVYAIAHSVLSPLGNTSEQNFRAIMQGRPAIRGYEDRAVSGAPFYAARLQPDQLQMIASRYPGRKEAISPFEQMCLYTVEEALRQTSVLPGGTDCILILSTTKGNIEWLGQKEDERLYLHSSAALIADFFQLAHKPIVVSNACISGSLALLTAKRLLEAGRYKHAIVVGCDRFSSFVFSGFQSFHALSDSICRPFDKDRNGINLGEAAACMVLSVDKASGCDEPLAVLAGGGISNDANHLSGPSRTGAELASAITAAFEEADATPALMGMISAHGTATIFNDEMEAKALHLAGVGQVPLHSLKSYIGHTLGAAGIIESIVACQAMQQQVLPASLGYKVSGVSEPVHVMTEARPSSYRYLLKTASGFGGCNAALVWRMAG